MLSLDPRASLPPDVGAPRLTYQKIQMNNKVLGFNCTFHFEKIKMIASGTDSDLETAVKKAFSESIERIFRIKHIKSPKWGFDKLNSTDGLAAGFSEVQTRNRSKFEAIERYIRATMLETPIPIRAMYEQTALASYISSLFTNAQTYCLQLRQENFNNKPLFFSLFAGYRDKSVFLGFSVDQDRLKSGEQACIEGHRRLTLVKLMQEQSQIVLKNSNVSRYQKVLKNSFKQKEVFDLLEMMEKTKAADYSIPKISFHVYQKYFDSFLCRTFIDNYLDVIKDSDSHVFS